MLYGMKIGWEMDRAESQGHPEKLTNDLKKAGLIPGSEKGSIQIDILRLR